MIRSILIIKNYLSRVRSRKQVHLDPKLKDLTSAQTFQKQVDQHRYVFEAHIPEKTISETLQQKNPKLGQRFKVDREELQKKLRKVIQKQLKVDRIVPGAQDQSFQTLQSKSHIYDQKAEIQFEQKFQKELFQKKQTNRLIQKEKNNFRNYLQEPKNVQFIEYEQNVKQFKNTKIDSMLNFKRNNEQLRLLIDSGYIDNPENLNIILDKMNAMPRLQHKLQNEVMSKQQQKVQGQKTKQQIIQVKPNTNTSQNVQIKSEIQQMHNKMIQNIKGPTQLRNASKLQEFFQKLEESSQFENTKARKDLQLIKKIKQFQTTTFQNRYNTLNFRFKGQVNFDWMKESELLSYIKNQKNPNTEPEGLLRMFVQNKSKLNKFNRPIITPTVMSRIYSVCSLYRFPQSDENNKINMLNDKKYIQIQKTLFKNIRQLSDQSFTDSVYAYSKHHKQQQGLLKRKMNQKIGESIFEELNERANYLEEEDLGMVLRSVSQTLILRNQSFNWGNIVQILSERLPLMQKQYEFESVMNFLTLVPVSESSLTAVQNNIQKFKHYRWQSKQTLQSFLQSCSFLIRFKNSLPPYRSDKLIQQMKHIFCKKYQQIMPLTEQISINIMPQLLSVIYYFQRSRPLDTKYEIEVPNKLINKCKKQIIDNVRQQKELIKKYTVSNLTLSMALTDYCKALIKRSQADISSFPVLQISTLKSLFTFRPLPFNSINYFTYHEMIKLVNSEIVNLPVKFIVQTLFANSIVRYKNEGIVEQILGKLVQKIYFQVKQSGLGQNVIHSKYVREYALVISSFHHSRMITEYYYHFCQKIIGCSPLYLVKLEPNLLLRLFQSVLALSFTTDQKYGQDLKIVDHFADLFQLCYEQNFKTCLKMLSKEETIVLEYVANLMHFYKVKSGKFKTENKELQKQQRLISQISFQTQKFQSHLDVQGKYLRQMSQLISRMGKYELNHDKSQNLASDSPKNQIKNIQFQEFEFQEFEQMQKRLYKIATPQMMEQQQHIGSQFKYETIYERIKGKLIEQNPSQTIVTKSWRIQVPDKKQVYFLATYEHLLAKYDEKITSVRLFGFWKIYSELYALKGWKFKLICTFLQG